MIDKEKYFLYRERIKQLNTSQVYKDCKWDLYKALDNYEWFNDILSAEEFEECKRFNRNRKGKRYRARKKTNDLVTSFISHGSPTGNLVFITLTFNDNQFFTSTGKPKTEETRTKKVNKILREFTNYAVANIDYGTKNDREHHHALAWTERELKPAIDKDTGEILKSNTGRDLYKFKDYPYDETIGFHTIEIIPIDKELEVTSKRIANYLVKITSHENKVTTKNRRIRVLTDEIQVSKELEKRRKAKRLLSPKKKKCDLRLP